MYLEIYVPTVKEIEVVDLRAIRGRGTKEEL